MKAIVEIIIDKPKERVVELFDNMDNLKKWQGGFIDYEDIDGIKGTKGARTRLRYEQKGKKIEMVETIISNNLPDEFIASFNVQGSESVIINKFFDEGPNRTKMYSNSDFKLKGFMKLLAPLMKNQFKKQIQQDLANFKQFVELQP